MIVVAEDSVLESAWQEQTFMAINTGQAGIYDWVTFQNDSVVEDSEGSDLPGLEWYRICCKQTLSEDRVGIIPYGVVCDTEYDGVCSYYTATRNGKVIGVAIDFTEEEEEHV